MSLPPVFGCHREERVVVPLQRDDFALAHLLPFLVGHALDVAADACAQLDRLSTWVEKRRPKEVEEAPLSRYIEALVQ